MSRRDAKRPVQHRPEDRKEPDSGPAVSEPQVYESRENLPVPVTSGPDGSDATVGTETPTDSGESSTDETDAEYTDGTTEEILDDYRQFATSVLDRNENTVNAPRGQVVRESEILVITEIGDFRTTPGLPESTTRLADTDSH